MQRKERQSTYSWTEVVGKRVLGIGNRACVVILEVESGSPVEMDVSRLDIDSLPSGERKFIDLIIGSSFGAYGVGHMGEQATAPAQPFRTPGSISWLLAA